MVVGSVEGWALAYVRPSLSGKLLRVGIPRSASTKLSVAGPGRCSGQHVAQYSTGRDEE
jgi:hypothetical protein